MVKKIRSSYDFFSVKGSLLCHVVWFWQGYDLMGVLSASHPALTEEIVLPFIQWLGFLFGSLALARHAHCSHKCSSFGWKHFGPFIGVVVVSIEVSASLATITIYGFHFCQSWYSQVDSNLRGYLRLLLTCDFDPPSPIIFVTSENQGDLRVLLYLALGLPHLSKFQSDFKQKCTRFLTPFPRTVFHAL